jgi:hypothetical protein
MAYDNKPNINNFQFQQENGDCFYFKGSNNIISGGTISSNSGYKISGVTVFNTGLYSTSIQIGCNAIASGSNSTVVGTASKGLGQTSIAIGCKTCSDGNSSIAIGNNSKSSGLNSISIGCGDSIGNYSIGIGVTQNSGLNSIAMGYRVNSVGNCSYTFGNNISNSSGCTFGIGWYNGGMGYEAPTILFSDNKSYIYGCGNPFVGFGERNPEARVDIKASGINGFRLRNGNEAPGKSLVSDINGFADWKYVGIMSGTTNYIPKYLGVTCIGNSIIKQIDNNVLELQNNSATIIRPKSGTTSYNSIEIHSGYKSGTDATCPIVLKASSVEILQPEENIPAKIKSDVNHGLHVSATYDSILMAGRGVSLGLCCGDYIHDIVFNTPSINNTLMCITRPSNFTLSSYTGVDINEDGCAIRVCSGLGNQSVGSNSNGGLILLKSGIGKGTGYGGDIIIETAHDTYLCGLNEKTSETCIVYIDGLGKLTHGCNVLGTVVTGETNYITKFNQNGDNVIKSSIYEDTNFLCLGKQTIILGDVNNSTSVVVKPRSSENSTPINLIIKPGCENINNTDGYVYLDPGVGGEFHHNIYIGSGSYNNDFVGIKPEGSYSDMGMYICGKNNGFVSLIGGGGVRIGSCENNAICINENHISRSSCHNLCIVGYDTNASNRNACSVVLRGGNAYGSNSRGGDLKLIAGVGSGTLVTCYGRIKMECLLPQTTETKILFIDDNGAISCGVSNSLSSCNGLTINSGYIGLGGSLNSNVNITSPVTQRSVSFCNGALINTQCGYNISGTTMFRTPTNTLSSIYIGCSVGTSSGGAYNVGIGNSVLNGITTGCNNFGVGSYSLFSNQSGCHNISMGSSNMQCNQSGCDNISFGKSALLCNTTGSRNLAIGMSALQCNITGSGNVGIGPYAGYQTNTSNRLYISNSPSCTLIYGEFDNKMVCINGNLCATSNMYAIAFNTTSDCRCKTNILNIPIQPIDVDYKVFNICNEPNQLRYGVIAQDLIQTNPELVREDSNGILSVSYIDLLIKEVSYLKCKVKGLEEKLNTL